jgi:signal transduction histidine kinase
MTPEAFAALSDVLPEPMLLVTASGRVLAANEKMRQLLGANFPGNREYGVEDIFRAPPTHLLEYLRLCSGVRHFIPGTVKLRIDSGEEIEVRCEGAALNFEDVAERQIVLRMKAKQVAVDRFHGLNGQIDLLNRQIAERKQVEEELRETRDAVREANARLLEKTNQLEILVQQRTAKLQELVGELESFSYSVAHDLRAPLRSLQGFSNALLEDYGDKLDEEGLNFLHRIAKAAARMDQLIRDVLGYTGVVRADLPLEKVDLEQLLPGVIDCYPMFAMGKAEIILKGSFPCVWANGAILTQIVSNLMGNAIKFVPPGVKPLLVVWAESAGDRVRLFMQDNGIGIAADQHEKIFGIFQRIDTSSEGTGIGLAIVKKAVERIGGKVGLESEVGKGSTFWIEVQSAESSDPSTITLRTTASE